MTQALHLMNAEKLHAKVVSNSGQIAKWAKSKMTDEELVETVYLSTYSRFPSEAEKKICQKIFAKKKRREALEDIVWTIINTAEFVLKN